MKKICLLIWIFLVAGMATEVYAQRFDGGLTGGLTASQVEGDHAKGYHKPGFLLGGYVQTDLSPWVFAGMEIRYSQKGSRKNPDPKDSEQKKYIMRLGYIDLPLLIGFRTSESIAIYTGFSIGYLMHSGEYDNYGLFPPEDQNPFKEFDYQAFLGFRWDITIRISLDLRGAYSVLPIRDLKGDISWFWWDDQYNNVLSTSVYYRLGR